MTAEVAILNKLAVSLAADSAITTGFPGHEKIFNGANKIFTLSKHAPVGVMIYGHVEHCSVPWEVIIKEYRRQLGRRRFPRIQDYADDFRRFIAQPRFITESAQETTVFGATFSAWATATSFLNKRDLKENSSNYSAAFDYMEGLAGEYSPLAQFESISKAGFLRRYGDVINAAFEDAEDFTIWLPQTSRSRFKDLVLASLKQSMTSAYYTGIVVAGFGEKEIFPSLVEIKVDGAIFDICRVIEGSNIDIDRGGETVFMKAFAQEDVVNSFLNGVDQDYQQYSAKMIAAFMGEFLEDILKQHTTYADDEKNVIRRLVRGNLLNSMQGFKERLADYSLKRYMGPVQDVLRHAPKDELAHVAEALVSLTSLKRKVSGERETVGGPVDVAVISKGDGFVWIKRKHYFASDLNHHFTRNYFSNDGAASETEERSETSRRKASLINGKFHASPQPVAPGRSDTGSSRSPQPSGNRRPRSL